MSPRAPYLRTPQPSPRQTAEQRLTRMEACGLKLAELALAARRAMQELDEAGSGLQSNGSIVGGRTSKDVSNPTYTAAVSTQHSIMRSRVSELVTLVTAIETRSLEKAVQTVERKAEDALRFANDPDMRSMLARADEADRDYRSRRRRITPL